MSELIADRFAVARDRRVVDLASGDDVVLVMSTSGGPSDERRWAARCDWFFGVRHHAVAELVDYGAMGEHQRFEAWRCGSAWRGSRQESGRVLHLAGAFLRANGLTTGESSAAAVGTRDGRPVVVPGAQTGHPVESAAVSAPISNPIDPDVFGIAIVERQAVRAIAELFDETDACRPRIVALGGPPGSGVQTSVTRLTRAARINGYIPISLDVLDAGTWELVQGRSLLVVARSDRPARAWRTLLDATIRSPRAHVLLFNGAAEIAGVQTVWLDRLPPRTLAEAITPDLADGAFRRRIDSAARRARGLPGTFAALIWGRASPPLVKTSFSTFPIAAERSALYGEEAAVTCESPPQVDARVWPAPGELKALKQKMESAIALVAAGRHTPGVRALRAAVAGLARRHDWDDASKGALAIAASLLRRGRPREAQQVLDDAKGYCCKAGLDGAMMEVAILYGAAWTDLGRFDEAESVLSVSLAAADSSREPLRTASTRLALARCLFWRGRYEEASRAVTPWDESRVPESAAIRRAIVLSRIAIGSRELETGVSGAFDALEAAQRAANPWLVAEAAYGVAFAHLATGDRAAVERDVAACLHAARATRDPLRALRARLLLAENERRAGRHAVATALVGRLRRIPAGSLPATVRARSALLADLLSTTSSAETVKRHVAATGMGALALFAPQGSPSQDIRAEANDIVEILRLCQTGDDDRRTLASLCALARARLRAAAVSFFISDRGALVPLVSDGSSRLGPETAARAIAAGQAVAPLRGHHVPEGGAPVRFGGDTIGALVARWTLGASLDAGRAALILTTAATAAGPAVAGALALRSGCQPRGDGDLIGTSAVMDDVRRSVERAAAAPFAVLIEGESGSGKELVARALHRRSPRRERPFCTLNCAALPDDLVEAELFGHARGAFTGAVAERPGVFEEAHTGTLFLDEIGELSPRAQAKVLRTIQEGELRRVGENVSRRIDLRIVSATNRDLRREVAEGRFRLDLLYRIDVVRIAVPPLRDRREDIALLVERFWREAIARVGSRAVLSTATVAALARYDWPGNVREVQNVLASLAVRSPRRGVIPATALPPSFETAQPNATWRFEEARRIFEQQFVRAALVRNGGHRSRAADELGVTRQWLTKLMMRLGISDAPGDTDPPENESAACDV